MPRQFDRQRAIQYFRLPPNADDARIARTIRGFAGKHSGAWRCFVNKTDLDPIECLAVIEDRLDHETRAAEMLDRQIQALIEKKRRQARRADLRILALNLIRFACYAPEDAGEAD